MRPDEYWKNFNLGTELDISGRFLFNSLRTFHEMEHFVFEEDAFEFLYGMSVGIERLLKIALILTEHDNSADQDEFEKSLITHSHQDLVKRLKVRHTIDLSPVHNEFISILSTFYKSHRYGRYSLASVAEPARERDHLNAFLEKHLNIKIEIERIFYITENEIRHKKFIGKVVSKIVIPIYEIIEKEASRINLYTSEINYESKASKIFLCRKFDFEDEDIMQAELIAYFVSKDSSGPNSKFFRDLVEPLAFDPALEADYLAALRSDRCKLRVLDELEALYEDIKSFKDRRNLLATAISSHLSYGDEEEDEGE